MQIDDLHIKSLNDALDVIPEHSKHEARKWGRECILAIYMSKSDPCSSPFNVVLKDECYILECRTTKFTRRIFIET